MSVWSGKSAIVCGGSSGLGLSIARQLVLQRAAKIILVARDMQRLQAAVEQLNALASETGASSVKVSAHVADLADRQAVVSLANRLSSVMPRIDLIIQAVGQSDRGKLCDLTRERLMELLDANVTSSLHAIQGFRQGLATGGGVIVLIGSLSSLFAPRFLGGYSIAKHGLAALAQQARLELAPEGIHVMLCCSGPIARPDAGHRYDHLAQQASGLPEDARRPGGGAKIKGLAPDWLSDQILRSAAARRPSVIYPTKVWWLRLVSSLSASLGDRILLSRTS